MEHKSVPKNHDLKVRKLSLFHWGEKLVTAHPKRINVCCCDWGGVLSGLLSDKFKLSF